MTKPCFSVLGSALSPFTWKLIALLDHAELPYRFLPPDGGALENLRIILRKEALVHGLLPLTWPRKTTLDEYPLVPFLFGPNGENLYDSTAIAHWLDRQGHTSSNGELGLNPEPAKAFIINLIDNYADEFLLYVVHHNRWVLSATDNTAGRRLGEELRLVMGPLAAGFGRRFARRQVRRLPYLFSVAEKGSHFDGIPESLQPPAPEGFPPTHRLLDEAFIALLRALECVLSKRNSLLGGHFTLADAAVYGALSMNLDDPSANQVIQCQAPASHAWLSDIRAHRMPEPGSGSPTLHEDLGALVHEALRLYVPLQQQNYAAWKRMLAAGQSRWNESAFNHGEALFNGTLDRKPFRTVVKSFQVSSWQTLCRQWQALDSDAHDELLQRWPELALFEAEQL